MEQEYNVEEGLELLRYVGIGLNEQETQRFKEMWYNFYKNAQSFNPGPSYRALNAAWTLSTGVGLLTDDPMVLLEREFQFDAGSEKIHERLEREKTSLREILNSSGLSDLSSRMN
jgi:hypothetical protein